MVLEQFFFFEKTSLNPLKLSLHFQITLVNLKNSQFN
jgi:hypothetical protein